MKASELAAEILRVVAEWGDYEIGVNISERLNGLPITDVACCWPPRQERDEWRTAALLD